MYRISEPTKLECEQNNLFHFNNFGNAYIFNDMDLNNVARSVMWTPPASVDSNESHMMSSPSSSSNSPTEIEQVYLQEMQPIYAAKPYLKILEQPMEGFRFRYKSEMTGTHGALVGATSQRLKKQTFPTVELLNYDQIAEIQCSLYQVGSYDEKREPHAHRLVMKQGNDEMDDPHTVVISKNNKYIATFPGMGILHTARSNVLNELARKKITARTLVMEQYGKKMNKMEEAKIKNEAENLSKTINLNLVCLRFDAFYRNESGILLPICEPVYSHKINNLKSALTGDLKIVRISNVCSPCTGNKEIFILVEKVTKKNIRVRFFELDGEGNEVWSDYGRFNDIDVHHQYAIVFRTPQYRTLDIDKTVMVLMELERPSDGARSEPKNFNFTPNENVGRKRTRVEESCSSSELPLSLDSLSTDIAAIQSDVIEKALADYNSNEFEEICNTLLAQSYKDMYVIQTDAGVSTDPTSMQIQKQHADDGKVQTNDVVKNIKYILNDIFAVLKSHSLMGKTLEIIKYNLEKTVNSDGDTILHASILHGFESQVMQILFSIIVKYKLNSIINITNKSKNTPLHIAAAMGYINLVRQMIIIGATVDLTDINGNTALHLALKENAKEEIVNLLSKDNNSTDIENNDGDIPIFIAIRTANYKAVVEIMKYQKNFNCQHKSTGYTALHIAVAERNPQIVETLLDHPGLELKEDWNSSTPVHLANILLDESNEKSKQIQSMLLTYTKIKNIRCAIKPEIKEEMEEDCFAVEEAEMSIEAMNKCDGRMSALSVLRYEKVAGFTPECLNRLAEIMDSSKLWVHLAKLLNHELFLKHGLLTNVSSSTKALLQFAINKGDTVLQIRNCLDSMDARDAVCIIDEMVHQHQ